MTTLDARMLADATETVLTELDEHLIVSWTRQSMPGRLE
jgi:hypothetical protein